MVKAILCGGPILHHSGQGNLDLLTVHQRSATEGVSYSCMTRLQRLRLYAANTFIAVIVLAVVIDTLPQTPLAVHLRLGPWLVRMGIRQDVWNLFAPEPDRVNTHL